MFHAVCVLQRALISASPVLDLPSVFTHLHGLHGGHVDAHLAVLVPGIAMLARRSRACPARWLIHLRVQHGQAAARDGTEHDHAPRWSAARPHQQILGLRRGVAEPHFHLTTGGQFASFSSRSCHGEAALDHHRPCCRWASLYLCRDRWPWTRALVVEGERWRRNEAWRPRFLRCPQRNQRRDFGAIRGLLYMARPASDMHGGSLSDVRAGTGVLCKGGDEGKHVAIIAAFA